MNCADCEILIHPLLDGELDAGHSRDVEAHVAACPGCAGRLAAFRRLRGAMAGRDLKAAAPAHLRRRIEQVLPAPAPVRAAAAKMLVPSSRRMFLGGLACGAALSGAVAVGVLLAALRGEGAQTLDAEIVFAHIRSLQPGHLVDVETSDGHTVKPWFDGKVDIAPPVMDLAGDGFVLIGGRLDYVDGNSAACVIYRRRQHLINLFVVRRGGADTAASARTLHGYTVRRWSQGGLGYFAVSDLDSEELRVFASRIAATLPPAP